MQMDKYQCLKLVYSDRLSSYFTKLSKNDMGASQGMSDAPNAPMTPHHTTTHPPTHPPKINLLHHNKATHTPHGPSKQSGAGMPDISWAPPNSLPIL